MSKRILFHLGHPAHFHLFRNVISNFKKKGFQIDILIKKKDTLEELLQKEAFEYKNLLPRGRKDTKFGIFLGMLKTDIRLLSYCLKRRPDIMIGTSYAISHVGKLLNIPSINVNEDDWDVVPFYSKLSYPWAKSILAPSVCRVGKWEKKTIKYEGYHELAYLHPNNFSPEKEVVKKYFNPDEPYFIIRFAKLKAHHDTGIKGITTDLAKTMINILEPHGKIYITSEREMEPFFEKFRMNINPIDIHHIMTFSSLYIGDSQTMAAEAGVLGTPFIRYNDFVGKIGYLKELEEKYELGFGFKTDQSEMMIEKLKELVKINEIKKTWIPKKEKMLSEKIDVASFMSWFIENYPSSVSVMKENPDYQYNFR